VKEQRIPEILSNTAQQVKRDPGRKQKRWKYQFQFNQNPQQ
jgi:hypothetical protein